LEDVALSGGSNRATALSLNACPYFANSLSHHRPRGSPILMERQVF
jgi:hypothetical protein